MGRSDNIAAEPPRRRHGRPIAVAAVLLLFVLTPLAYYFGPAVYRFTTNQGVLTIETDDPDVTVIVKQKGEHIRIVDRRTGREVTLTAGQYQVELAGGKPGLKLSSAQFILKRGGAEIVKVLFEPKVAKAAVGRPAIAEPPFVILTRAAKADRWFAGLAEAVAGADSGDVIEIRGDGPFDCSPMVIKDKALVIRAAGGFRPVLQITPKSLGNANPWLGTNSALVLEGLEFHAPNQLIVSERAPRNLLLVSSEASLYVCHCRFFLQRMENGTRLIPVTFKGPAACELRNCEFLGAKGRNLDWFCSPQSKMVVDNCLISGAGMAVTILPREDPQDVSLQLTHNTFNTNTSFRMFLDYHRLPRTPVQVQASANILEPSNLFHISSSGALPPEFTNDHGALIRRVISWREHRNLYSEGQKFVDVRAGGKPLLTTGESPLRTLETWQQFWQQKDTGSLLGKVRYEEGDPREQLVENPRDLPPSRFRLHPESAGKGADAGGKDLGCDVDLLGPGQAYERWKKTPAYLRWLQDTGQRPVEPLAEPFFVLARDKKPERTFATLNKAVAWASSGDVIEIRGNGPFDCSPMVIKDQALVIRAGGGFRPVLRTNLETLQGRARWLKTNAPLVLEGLEFHQFGGPNRLIIGPALHMGHCRFFLKRAETGTQLIAVSVEGTGSSVVRNCEFLGAVHCAIDWFCPPKGNIVVDNCLICWATAGIVIHPHDNTQEVSLQLTHSTFNANMSFQVFDDDPSRKQATAPVQIQATDNILGPWNLFGRRYAKLQGLQGFERTIGWREARNLYSEGQNFLWVDKQPTTSLAAWQQFWRLKDTGSLQGQVRYEGGDLSDKMTANPVLAPAGYFRLHSKSAGKGAGAGGKDLGCDVDRLGPGPAYERWKKTPAYQVWLKDTGQVR